MAATEAPAGVAESELITVDELALAARNHGMPLEGLRHDLTPLGMHYLLIHFDIPAADADSWRVSVEGRVDRPLSLSVPDLRARPHVTHVVTMECAGNGRALMTPRPLSQPWLAEAVGTAEWTGTPLAPILDEAGLGDEVVELVFVGADHGVQGDVEQDYARSLSVDEARREGVILAWEVNGLPLPPQHGAPVRLVVPGWYGMTSVKWLTSITAVTEPFDGYQMWAYRLRDTEEQEGRAVTRIQPRALMIPPGFPDFYTRGRMLDRGPVTLEGKAWSGWGPIDRVEFSPDGGSTWLAAALGPAPPAPYAWRSWSFAWDAMPGEHVLACRARDAEGNEQPLEQPWNLHGLSNNEVQRVVVTVR